MHFTMIYKRHCVKHKYSTLSVERAYAGAEVMLQKQTNKKKKTICHPKKLNAQVEEVDDIARYVDRKFLLVRKQQKTSIGLVEEVKTLRVQNIKEDERFLLLENQVADLEQFKSSHANVEQE